MARGGAAFPACAAVAYPGYQALSLPPQNGQCRAIYPLRAQHVDIIKFSKRVRCEIFGGAENHVPSVVNHNIQPPVLLHNLLRSVILVP